MKKIPEYSMIEGSKTWNLKTEFNWNIYIYNIWSR